MTTQSNTNGFSAEMPSEELHASNPIRIRRRIHIHISGTMANFHKQGDMSATWHPREGKIAEVFGLDDAFENSVDHTTATSTLRTAMIISANMLEQQSTFPVPLGVSINCLNPDEATQTGERYACTVLPNSSNTTPVQIFEADGTSAESLAWRSKYPQYNDTNLESHGVLNIDRQPYVFVDKNHPVVEMLRLNKDVLNADIDKQQLIDGQYYKVTKQVMNSMCTAIRQKVLSKVSTRDLNNFQVQLHRMDGKAWNFLGKEDLGTGPLNENEQCDRQATLLNTHCNYIARLDLVYEIHP